MRKVVGIHACKEIFKVWPSSVISKIYLKKGYKETPQLSELFDLAKKNKIHIQEIHPQELDKISSVHQGVAIDIKETPSLDWPSLETTDGFLIGLDGIEDPQNLGSILRTGWLMGVTGILSLISRSVGLTPTVCKVASGGAEHVPVEEYNQLIQPIGDLKEKGYWVYGLSEKAEKNLWDIEFPPKVILVAGNETKGLKPQTIKACDELIKIPQIDSEASYNVAISLTIAMAEVARQRQQKK